MRLPSAFAVTALAAAAVMHLALATTAEAQATRCANPTALGVSRTVEIDTTSGPCFGFEHFNAHDFLQKGEVVLTFDDGPWPNTTPSARIPGRTRTWRR